MALPLQPPPGFPFREAFDMNLNPVNQARPGRPAAGIHLAAAAMAAEMNRVGQNAGQFRQPNPDLTEGIPFGGLRI